MTKLLIDSAFRTSDLALVGAVSLYFPIESIEKETGNKTWFLFSRSAELDKFLEAYWRGEIQVEPQIYFNQLRIIKSRLYSNG